MPDAPARDWASRPASRAWVLPLLAPHLLLATVRGRSLWRRGAARAIRLLVADALGAGLQLMVIAHLRRRVGPSRATVADALTLVRAGAGSTLLALVVGGGRDEAHPSRALACALLLGAIATDWIDGPLARRHGPSRLGAVLDIEADSLLTLAGAAAAVRWGALPRVTLLPPVLRYVDPILALWRGDLPSGGGPWWCRASGFAQMGLVLAALAPGLSHTQRWRRPVARIVAIAQVTTQLGDGRRRNAGTLSTWMTGRRASGHRDHRQGSSHDPAASA